VYSLFLNVIYINAQNYSILNIDSLDFELCQLYAYDQSLRNNISFDLDSCALSARTKFMLRIDSLNFVKAMFFIKRYGFPSKNIFKEKYDHECILMSLVVILLHNPQKAIMAENYKILKEEVLKGNLSPITLSYILDRYYIVYQKKTLYNSPYAKGLKICKEDREISNELRAEIGLDILPDSFFTDCEKDNN
jgi:hypothetical protein